MRATAAGAVADSGQDFRRPANSVKIREEFAGA
jgi:hypothetical protein